MEAVIEKDVREKRTFAVGDKVVLNSGGPVMTVFDIGINTGHLWCKWEKVNPDDSFIPEARFPPACVTSHRD